jgi:hypothetical protein
VEIWVNTDPTVVPYAFVQDYIDKVVRRENDAIEEACEFSLTDPSGHGVKVERWPTTTHVFTSPDVPYGEIHDQRMY